MAAQMAFDTPLGSATHFLLTHPNVFAAGGEGGVLGQPPTCDCRVEIIWPSPFLVSMFVKNFPIGGSELDVTSVGVTEVEPAAIGHFCLPPFVKSMMTVDSPLRLASRGRTRSPCPA